MSVDIATLQIRIDSLEARTATRDMNNMREAGGRAEQAVKAMAAVFATIKAAESLIETQRAFDKLNASLITATGSVKNATQAFGALQAFAASTPYGLAEVTKAFIQLRNLGLTPSERALNSYGNTASAMSKSLNQMVEAVADAATGEFERLKEFGIKAKQNGDQVSVTFQGVTSNIKNNAVAIEKYLIELGETKFGGGMELQARTLDGAISNLGDTWDFVKLKISQSGFGDAAQAGVLSLTGALTDLVAILDVAAGAADKEGAAVKEAGVLHKAITTAFEAIAVLGVNVIYTFQQVGAELGGLAAQAVAVAHGDLAGAKAIGVAMRADAEAARKAVDEKTDAILGAAVKAKKAADEEAEAKKAAGRDDLERYAIKQGKAQQSAEAIKKEAEAYASLVTSIRSAIAENRIELAVGASATESQKTGIKVTQELASGKLKLGAAHLAAVRSALAEQAATESLLKTQQAAKVVADTLADSAQARNLSNATLSAEYALYGQTSDARDIAMIAVKAETDLEKFLSDQRRAGVAISDEMVAGLEAERDMRVSVEQATMAQSKALGYAASLKTENTKFSAETIADPKARANALLEIDADVWRKRIELAGAGTEAQKLLQGEFNTWYANQSQKVLVDVDLTRATELLKIMEAVDAAARQAASGMEASFGAVGKAIGGLTTALTGYSSAQAAVAAQLAAATKDAGGDTGKIAKANAAAAQQGAQAQIKSYGDMAGAAKGFFKENTAGYRAMEGAEKAYRAVEMAMAVQAMLEKSGLLVAFTGLFAASKATEVAATVATVPVTVAAEGVKQTALATTAMAGAVAVPFPGNVVAFGIVAAMLAAIGLGGFGGGGGSVDVAKERQAAAGTGSVLGDESAKSESIAKSIENLEKYSSIELSHTRGMLSALLSIRDTIGVVAAMATQTAGLRATAIDEKNFGVGSSSGVLGIGASSTTIQDSGIKLSGSQSIGSAISGIDAKGYVDIQKKNSGLWGIGASTSNRRDDVALDDSIKKQFGLVLASMRDGTLAAIDLLGMSSAGVVDKINAMALGVNEISFKGLTGAEIQKELEAVFSKVGDDIAKVAAPELTSFEKVGEGYLQTLTRIATDYATIDSIMEATGKTFGSVGVASIQAREDLIKFAGGLDKLAEKSAYFVDNFLSDAEKAAPAIKYAAAEMAALGYSSVTTADQFKALVLSIDPSTKAGGELYAKLLDLAPAFKTAADAAQAAITKAQDAAKVTAGLDGQIYDLTHTAAEALARQRQLELAAMTATDAALQKRIYALGDEKSAMAAAKEKQAADLATIKGARGGIADEIFKALLGGKDLQGKIDQLKSAETAAWSGVGSGADSIAVLEKIKALAMQRIDLEGQLQDKAVADLKTQYGLREQGLTTELNAMIKMRDFAQQLLGYTNGLKLGDLSALSPTAKLAEAESQYRTTLGKARDGDVAAQGGLQGIAQTYLQLQKQYSGSTSAYASTYASVIGALEGLAGSAPTDPQIESQKLQISTIQSTSAALSTTVRDTSAKQIEVLKRIDDAMAKSQTNVEAQLAQAGAANAALVEELKKSNGKLAEIEARMARMEASA